MTNQNFISRVLTVPEINNLIELLIADDAPLHAVEREGEVYLVNPGDEDLPLDAENRTREELPKLLYDYAVHFGYTNDDFGEWMGS